MRDSKSSRRTAWAHKKGYRVLLDGSVRSHVGRNRKLNKCSGGYFRFTVGPPGNHGWIHVHVLAGLQYFGERALAEGTQVRHLDGDKINNLRENLALGSPSDNALDISPTIRFGRARHAALSQRKLSSEEAESLRSDRAAGFTYSRLMEKYGIAKSTVSYIVNRKTYT
jgi:hypothetical protein